jgi:cytochrome P450
MTQAATPPDGAQTYGHPQGQPMPRLPLRVLVDRVLHPARERDDMHAGLREIYDAYGPVSCQSLPMIKMVNLLGPDANRLVLLDQQRIFSARKPWMAIMGRIFPNGLLLMDGEQHKTHRRIMHTAFKRPDLRDYAAQMNPMIANSVESWYRDGEPVEIFPAVKRLTLDMAASIFIGAELGPATEGMKTAFEHLVSASMSRIRLPLPGLEFDRGLRARRFMVDFLSKLIEEKRGGHETDLLARLERTITPEGERFKDSEIVDHMSFLMMAAHDTTTSTLCSMIYELAKHPEWQDRIREEVLAIGDEELDFDDAHRIESVSLVLQETLRRYPPLPVIPRMAERDFEFAGYHVPAGAMVLVSPIFTHHMPEWWDDPWRFDPERFGSKRAEHERHSHHFIPFGGGPHMCLGKRFAETQVTTVLYHLLRRYRLRVPESYIMPVQQAPISKPRDGLPVWLERL